MEKQRNIADIICCKAKKEPAQEPNGKAKYRPRSKPIKEYLSTIPLAQENVLPASFGCRHWPISALYKKTWFVSALWSQLISCKAKALLLNSSSEDLRSTIPSSGIGGK